MAISKSVQEQLPRIKKNIETCYSYNKDNIKRFHDFRKYVYKSSINESQRTALAEMRKPAVEFNILPAYLSRLLGEFAKHEPSIAVTPNEGVPVPVETIEAVEGHIRHVIYEANKNSFSWRVYQDLLSGGFSVFKVYTDYATPMSFKQVIKWTRAFDPTMCGFDPMARDPHKGDGQYCFEIYPITEEDFKSRYDEYDVGKLKYSRNFDKHGNLGGFNWSYKDALQNKILICASYWEKKKKKIRIVELADGRTMTVKQYEDMKANWKYVEQIPVQLGEPRWTEIETICFYTLNENEILDYEETDYSYLPLVYISGNSIELTEGQSNTVYEMTIPYVYHAKGAQDLKNFGGQSLANYLENMLQQKWIVKKEALPQELDYINNLTEIQFATTVVVNAFNENDPTQAIPEPIREVMNPPAPPEIMNSFQIADITTQTILGSFASNLGKNDNDLSGKAVIESASVGNAAAMPYMMGYLAGIKHGAIITADLMPKYLLGRREIPVVNKKGKKSYQTVNAEGAPSIDYTQGALQVEIEPGVSFQVQKTQAMEQIVALMQASPQFAEFMNSEEGLPVLLKNLTIHGSDELQEMVPQWMQKKAQQQQQAQQMQMQMMQQDPRMIQAKASTVKAQADIMKVQMDGQQMAQEQQQQQFENQLAIAELAIKQENAQNETILARHQASLEETQQAVQLDKAQAEVISHSLDAAAKIANIKHKERMAEHESIRKTIDMHHKLKNGSDKEKEDENA